MSSNSIQRGSVYIAIFGVVMLVLGLVGFYFTINTTNEASAAEVVRGVTEKRFKVRIIGGYSSIRHVIDIKTGAEYIVNSRGGIIKLEKVQKSQK